MEIREDADLFPEEYNGISRSYYYEDVKVTRFCDEDKPIHAGAGGFIVDDDEAMVAMIENDTIKEMVSDYVDRGDIVLAAFSGSETIALAFYRK